MREKFNQFMQGRYGYDDLNRFLSKVFFVALILSLIGTFAGGWIPGIAVVSRVLYWIALVCLAYCYFRMFSRNIYKRSEENNRFLQRTEGVRSFFRNKKKYHGTEKILPYLFLPRMHTENKNYLRIRKDRSTLSEMWKNIYKKELRCSGILLSINQK